MSEPNNLAAYLERPSDANAVVVGARAVSHAELATQVARWRGGLVASGVRAGDRVAIVAGNTLDFVVAHLAAIGIGAVSVPLNPQAPAAELARELAMVDPFAAIADTSSAELLADGVTLTPETAVQVLSSQDLEIGQPHPLVDVSKDDPALLLFTGQSHVFVGVIPLFHVFGLNTVLHLSLLTGGLLVLADFAGPGETINLISQHQATVVAGPPTLWRALTRHPDTDGDALQSVVLAVSGAAKLPPQLKTDTESRFGITLHEGYGLTESSAVVASTLATDAPLGSVGKLLPGVNARIVNQAGEDCLIGDPGELWVRGPMVFPGYWGEQAGSGPLTEDGWLKTGDVALVDDDGYLAIVDRQKDLIIVSGFNVFPAEVEAVLAAHPDVADVGVVGEPSERTGEAVVAFVVPEDDVTLAESELRQHCEAELARYKIPHRFVIAPDLPVGPTGKLQRTRLQ